jgi:hypothetical protein
LPIPNTLAYLALLLIKKFYGIDTRSGGHDEGHGVDLVDGDEVLLLLAEVLQLKKIGILKMSSELSTITIMLRVSY